MAYPKGWPPAETIRCTWNTGGQVLSALDEGSLTSYAVGISKALVGLGANPKAPHLRRGYTDLVCPFNRPQDQRDLITKSGCGLTGLGLLRCLGIGNTPEAGREVWEPYRPGMAFSDLLTIALRTHTRKPWDTEPVPGDIVIVGTDPPAGATPEQIAHLRAVWGMPGHALIVTATPDDREVQSVDGGQTDDEGLQTIKAKTRPLTRPSGQVWIGNRRVYAVLRVRELGRFLTEGATWPVI